LENRKKRQTINMDTDIGGEKKKKKGLEETSNAKNPALILEKTI